MSIVDQLKHFLPPCFLARIHHAHPPPDTNTPSSPEGFVLYLPTVNLRKEQNPAFALACHVANQRNIPLVILAVLLDDANHNSSDCNNNSTSGPTVMTSRRLAFTLQALSHACSLWSAHGAAVGIRIHAPPNSNARRTIVGARTPDHLTMASRATFVVTDEPFVNPYLSMVQRIEEACRKSSVECVRVDGSCTVPPLQILKRTGRRDGVLFAGVPDKAYLWEKKTEGLRMGHLNTARDGGFDAPELNVRMKDDELFYPLTKSGLAKLFPSRWKPIEDADGRFSLPNAPDVRPFTSRELSQLGLHDDYFDPSNSVTDYQSPPPLSVEQNSEELEFIQPKSTPFYNFAINWPGADPTVPPVPHTIGTSLHGMARWEAFVINGGLSRYSKERNDARNNLNGVSRMSSYLNLGVVSVFQLVLEMKKHSTGTTNTKWKTGADKFEEELVKFREHSYAYCFSRTDYDTVASLPHWCVNFLNNKAGTYDVLRLVNGATECKKWNAMQKYLIHTGELHNNVRMTWGKTVVEWGVVKSERDSTTMSQSILKALCYLNDRYALDGLSPPSYGGLLWCMGWTDKPDMCGGVSSKPAFRYRMTVDDFVQAQKHLMASNPGLLIIKNKAKRQVLLHDYKYGETGSEKLPVKTLKRNATIDSFFPRKSPK